VSQIAKHIIFIGRVQGVGFRFTAYHIANRYELTGQVRNLPDGSVEMIVQGYPNDVEDTICNLKETFGVRETNITEIPVNSQYKDFKITF